MRVENSTILVTGAGGGIGSALCRQLSAAGARLILNGVHQQPLDALMAELGPRHIAVAADIGTDEGRETLAQLCERNTIDGVINLAGILDFALFADQHPQRIRAMLEVNTLGTILLTHDLLPLLLRRPRGRIVNVGSIFGSIGHPGFAVYCASKAALKTFSEALARELADTGVSVAYIAPRATRTALNGDRITALNEALGNRTDAPEQVATAIVSLYESGKGHRFLGWPERLFVKINAVLPGIVHGALVRKLPVIKQYARQGEPATTGDHS